MAAPANGARRESCIGPAATRLIAGQRERGGAEGDPLSPLLLQASTLPGHDLYPLSSSILTHPRFTPSTTTSSQKSGLALTASPSAGGSPPPVFPSHLASLLAASIAMEHDRRNTGISYHQQRSSPVQAYSPYSTSSSQGQFSPVPSQLGARGSTSSEGNWPGHQQMDNSRPWLQGSEESIQSTSSKS